MNDFSLLEFLGVDDGTKQLTKAEIDASERRAKAKFNEYQYRAHVEQEKVMKQRMEQSLTGRSVRAAHQEREHRHHHGNFWFAQGSIPQSHDNVGTSALGTNNGSGGVIVHQLDPSQPPLPTEGGIAISSGGAAGGGVNGAWGFNADLADGEAPPINAGAPKPAEIVIRPKLPPPPPKLSYEATPGSPRDTVTFAQMQAAHAVSPRGASRMMPSPVNAPATPRSAMSPSGSRYEQPGGGISPVPNSANGSHLGRSRTPPASSARRDRSGHQSSGFVAPYAEHYDADALYDVDEPIKNFTLGGYQMDRKGIPRGRNGIDHEEGQAREAQRLGEEMRKHNEIVQKRERQDLLRQQLDHLVDIKRDQRMEERELEDRAVFGYSLPGVGKDVASGRQRRRESRKELERVWLKQAEEREVKKAQEEAYYAKPEEDWEGLWNQMEQGRKREAETPAAVQSEAQKAWVGAWQEHKAADASIRIAADKEKARIQAAELKPHVANYADRILLGEQVRRQQHEQYKRELDDQVQQKQYDKSQRIVKNYRRDNQFHRPPFVTYGDSFH